MEKKFSNTLYAVIDKILGEILFFFFFWECKFKYMVVLSIDLLNTNTVIFSNDNKIQYSYVF